MLKERDGRQEIEKGEVREKQTGGGGLWGGCGAGNGQGDCIPDCTPTTHHANILSLFGEL